MQTPTTLPKEVRPSPEHLLDPQTGEWVPPPIDVMRSSALARIDGYHTEVIQQLVGSPTQTEKDTWALKLETANAISRSEQPTAAGDAFLQAAGLIEPGAQLAWASVVLKKSANYATVVGIAERLRDEAKLSVKAAQSHQAIEQAMKDQREKASKAVAALSA